MLRFMLIGGLLLMCGSVALLLVAFLAPADTPLGDVFADIACETTETLAREVGPERYDSFNNSSSRSVTFYCQDAFGNQRDVTGTVVAIAVGMFLAMFLSGLFRNADGFPDLSGDNPAFSILPLLRS